VPKLSLGDGLVYTYTKPERDDSEDAWYLTAVDFRNGKTRWSRLAGVGLGFNNNYAPVTIAPNGTAYVGVLGGVTMFRDTPP
jgi:outer membrane protein assembly factor BamB